MSGKYEQLHDYDGVVMKSKEMFKFECCDCKLVHNVVLVCGRKGTPIGFAVARNKRSTAQKRKKK